MLLDSFLPSRRLIAMKVQRHAFLASLVLAGFAATGADAQGIPKNSRRLGQPSSGSASATRIMVATPFAFNAQDSLPAVTIARGMRSKLKDVGGSDIAIVSDSIMNVALDQFGYAKDAVLTPPLALQLAKQLPGTKGVITSQLQRHEHDEGRYTLTSRLFPTLEDGGVVVTTEQQQGEKLEDFGKRAAEQLKPAVSVFDDAKECTDLAKSKPEDAIKAAQKAQKVIPNHGGAHLCEAQVTAAKGAPRPEVVAHLEQAVQGDPLSLTAWSLLAENHQALADANKSKADSAKVVEDMKQMLRIAPANQKMRESIFKYLLQTGKPDVAVQVADEGLKLDPYNWDLYDLKSNACLFQSNFPCAIDALEAAYQVDSTRADSLFYRKISVAAAQQPDTIRLAKWAGRGVARYPDNVELLGYANQGYVLSGKLDSSVAVTRKLLAIDPTQVDPALAAVQGLANAKRLPEAKEFADLVVAKGSPEQKEQLAGIYVNAAAPLLQDPNKDYAAAAELTRNCVAVANPQGRVAPSCNFILGVSAFQLAAAMDSDTEKQKSCDMARQENALLLEAEKGLTTGRAVRAETADQLLGYVNQFKTRTSSMMKAYCK
jgi:tetratricopeptide (TPR) repeat protein